ncbi:WecB/TagA/CpsF family glycosyltransferase [Microbulbifer elongatus]|uniref:WecB/TagA/CpsF family glycosyltransferase n=1 Tax=Microbulbifer elongatus TaxID=86173 RepID=UPI001CFE667A|nr:WecB/TagA/CpsF family glycosyltransferase [Microbulbifer elongatus]
MTTGESSVVIDDMDVKEEAGAATNQVSEDDHPQYLPQPADLGFCLLHDMDQNQVLMWLRRQCSAGSYGYVVTPNIDHVQRLYTLSQQSSLVKLYRGAALSLCDSRILQKLLAVTGHKAPAVVTGSGLTAQMFESFLTPRDNIVIIGGSDRLISRLREMYPQLQIAHRNPTMGFINKPDEIESLVAFCHDARSDFIFLAVGSPQQELLAERLGNVLERGTALCIGASLHFIVGEEQRAPAWMQNLSCEWLYRLLVNPRRLAGRYFSNFCHLWPLAKRLRQVSRADQAAV